MFKDIFFVKIRMQFSTLDIFQSFMKTNICYMFTTSKFSQLSRIKKDCRTLPSRKHIIVDSFRPILLQTNWLNYKSFLNPSSYGLQMIKYEFRFKLPSKHTLFWEMFLGFGFDFSIKPFTLILFWYNIFGSLCYITKKTIYF